MLILQHIIKLLKSIKIIKTPILNNYQYLP